MTLFVTAFWLWGRASRGFVEEDEAALSLLSVDVLGRDLEGLGRRADSIKDCSIARAISASWAKRDLARSLSASSDNAKASFNSSSSVIVGESSAGDFASEGKVSRVVSLVSGGPFTVELGRALGETLDCAKGCGSGLRVTVSEEERAPRGFGGGGGGGGGTCGRLDAPRDISRYGWDLERGNPVG